MRGGGWRWLISLAVLTAGLTAMALAQPPAPPGPKNGVEDTAAQRARLQAELMELLQRVKAAPATGPGMPPVTPPMPKPPDPVAVGKSIDAIGEGMNLFRANDFESARRVFQLIDPATLGREDRAFVRYMLASSLRRLGKTAEAEAIYREVANAKDDEFLANCAIWQLSLIRSEQELQAQFEQLRSRAKSK
jgi:hypothetical protein